MNTPYEVLSISDTTGLNDAGQLSEMKVIRYRSAHGDTGDVRIEKVRYTAEAVRELIEAEIKENDALRGIK